MGFWDYFHTQTWIKQHGVQVNARITQLSSSDNQVLNSSLEVVAYNTTYNLTAEGYNPVSGKYKKFYKEVSQGEYRSLKKGDQVLVYIHPTHPSRYVVDI